MKRFTVLAAVSLFLALAFPLTAQAQMESGSTIEVGPRATLALQDISDCCGGDLALGGEVRFQPAEFPVKGSAAFDYYFADDNVSVYTVDVNVLYPIGASEAIEPYVGAGLGYTNISFDTDTPFGGIGGSDTGLNIVGGLQFETGGALRPFVEGRFTAGGDLDRFGITGGVLFAL